MIVYAVKMTRWADEENHAYISGVYSTLPQALNEGLRHSAVRAHKYEPVITMISIDSHDTFNVLCRCSREAEELYKSITGKEWKDIEDEIITTARSGTE